MTGTEAKETGGDRSASADDSKKETDLQTAIDSLQASAAALKDLVGTPPPAVMAEGSGTAVVGQVAYRMLDLAAGAIAAAVPPGVRPLIVERTDLARWKCEHEAVKLRLDAVTTLINEQARACRTHLESAPSGAVSGLAEIGEGGAPTKGVSIFGLPPLDFAGIANVATAGALAVGNVVRFLTPTLRVSARQTTLESAALVAAVAGRLAAEKRPVASLRWAPGADAPELLKRLEAVRTAADGLAVKAAVLEAAVEAKREDEEWRKTAAALAAASRALLKESAVSFGGIGEACGSDSPLAGPCPGRARPDRTLPTTSASSSCNRAATWSSGSGGWGPASSTSAAVWLSGRSSTAGTGFSARGRSPSWARSRVIRPRPGTGCSGS